jgi:hypothetical protein
MKSSLPGFRFANPTYLVTPTSIRQNLQIMGLSHRSRQPRQNSVAALRLQKRRHAVTGTEYERGPFIELAPLTDGVMHKTGFFAQSRAGHGRTRAEAGAFFLLPSCISGYG